MTLRPGRLYNNPRPVEYPEGRAEQSFLAFYGWEGPGSIQPVEAGPPASKLWGKAYLWSNGEWL